MEETLQPGEAGGFRRWLARHAESNLRLARRLLSERRMTEAGLAVLPEELSRTAAKQK